MLVGRRVQIDPAYRNRQKFIAATGLNERLVADVENARRFSYRAATVASFEDAYQLTRGSFDRVLQGGEFGIAHLGSARMSATSSMTAVPEVALAAPDDLPEDVVWDDLPPIEQHLWLLPAGLHLRQALVNIARAYEEEVSGGAGIDQPERRRRLA
jgi:hypothetical protein